MKGKSETLSLDRPVPKKANLGRIKPSVVVMGLVLLLLVAVTAALVVAVVRPEISAGIEAGIEANSARWSALGAHYAAKATSGQKFVDTVWAYEAAFQAGDVDQLIEFYAPDAVSLPPGFPASVGKEAIEADLRWFFGEYELERDFALADYEIAGNYATRLGEWRQTLTPKSGGDPIVETGRCILGFAKMQGEWKVVWEIWNTYEPPE